METDLGTLVGTADPETLSAPEILGIMVTCTTGLFVWFRKSGWW